MASGHILYAREQYAEARAGRTPPSDMATDAGRTPPSDMATDARERVMRALRIRHTKTAAEDARVARLTRALELREEGKTWGQVARTMNDEGISPTLFGGHRTYRAVNVKDMLWYAGLI